MRLTVNTLVLLLGSVLIFVSLLACPLANGQVVNDLYSAKLVVPNQSAQAWDQASADAFKQVLIKLTGNPEVVNNSFIKQAIPKAKLWVKSYSYHEQWQHDESQLWLRFDFDTKALNQLLQQAHQTKWSNDRPLTLIWVEQDQGEAKPSLMDAQNSYKNLIQQNADRRGIPILLPALDLEDQQHLGQALTNPALWEWAFTRYGVKAVLVGQLKLENDQWQGQWLLVAGNDSKQWRAKPAAMNEAIAEAIDKAADQMARSLMVGNDPNAKIQKLVVQVADVQDIGDYAKISDYLSQLSFIKHVSLGGVGAEGMIFELQVAGTKEQLVKALSTSSELIPDETHPESNKILYYRWAQGAASEPSIELKAEELK